MSLPTTQAKLKEAIKETPERKALLTAFYKEYRINPYLLKQAEKEYTRTISAAEENVSVAAAELQAAIDALENASRAGFEPDRSDFVRVNAYRDEVSRAQAALANSKEYATRYVREAEAVYWAWAEERLRRGRRAAETAQSKVDAAKQEREKVIEAEKIKEVSQYLSGGVYQKDAGEAAIKAAEDNVVSLRKERDELEA